MYSSFKTYIYMYDNFYILMVASTKLDQWNEINWIELKINKQITYVNKAKCCWFKWFWVFTYIACKLSLCDCVVLASSYLNFEYIICKMYLTQPQRYIHTNKLSNTTYISTTAICLGFTNKSDNGLLVKAKTYNCG